MASCIVKSRAVAVLFHNPPQHKNDNGQGGKTHHKNITNTTKKQQQYDGKNPAKQVIPIRTMRRVPVMQPIKIGTSSIVQEPGMDETIRHSNRLQGMMETNSTAGIA